MAHKQKPGEHEMPPMPDIISVHDIPRIVGAEPMEMLPLRKAIAVDGTEVDRCMERCFKELRESENFSVIRKTGRALREWLDAHKSKNGLSSDLEIPEDALTDYLQRADVMLETVEQDFWRSPKTELNIHTTDDPTGFTQQDRDEARARIIKLTTIATTICSAYETSGEADDMIKHVVAPTPGSVSEGFKRILVERAWIYSRGY